MKCGHCGSERDMTLLAHVKYNAESGFLDNYGRVEWWDVAVLKQCLQCMELVLYKYDDGELVDHDQHTTTILYPRHRDLSALPANVRSEYEKAQKAKSIDPGFYALGIRRILEAVCNDKEISGQNLQSRLAKLVQVSTLPTFFGEMGQYLRHLGNAGAHVGDIEVNQSDANAASDFVEAILEYLYIAPAKLKLVSDELAARKAADKEDDDQVGT